MADMKIALLGDSTIDNVVWVARPDDEDGGASRAVPGQLHAQLPDATILNLAADGFTTGDVLEGGNTRISHAARERAGDPFPVSVDDDFAPLPLLEEAENVTHAVLSVGGNDIREILGDLNGRLVSAAQAFAENYPAIVMRVNAAVPQTVLMLQYRPCRSTDYTGYGVYTAMNGLPGPGSCVAKMNQLMARMYEPVLALARALQLPVIDLPRTFDIHNKDLYSHQIEPSELGGGVIAVLIAHVVSHHDFSGPSMLYRAEDGGLGVVVAEENREDVAWAVGDDDAHAEDDGGIAVGNAGAGEYALELAQLLGMGMEDEKTLCALLHKHGGSVEMVVAELLEQ